MWASAPELRMGRGLEGGRVGGWGCRAGSGVCTAPPHATSSPSHLSSSVVARGHSVLATHAGVAARAWPAPPAQAVREGVRGSTHQWHKGIRPCGSGRAGNPLPAPLLHVDGVPEPVASQSVARQRVVELARCWCVVCKVTARCAVVLGCWALHHTVLELFAMWLCVVCPDQRWNMRGAPGARHRGVVHMFAHGAHMPCACNV